MDDDGEMKDTAEDRKVDDSVLSFVVIGLNEAATLVACLHAVRAAELPSGISSELLYVDGGSRDESIRLARDAGVHRVLGGEGRRKASQNRNLGLEAARGKYVQFVDGDMVIAHDWPAAALAFLEGHPQAAAVCGNLQEARSSVLFKAFEIDWSPREGVIRHCGGAAMYRRATLEKLGGFPVDVEYGEEPYLCWRIRNELGLEIHQLNRRMADHDLSYEGLRDYWGRNTRLGATYAEIAALCAMSQDRLWLREASTNLLLAALIAGGAVGIALGRPWMKVAILAITAAILIRKWFQTRRKGYPIAVSLVYALHTYLSKVPLSVGEVQWVWGRVRKKR